MPNAAPSNHELITLLYSPLNLRGDEGGLGLVTDTNH
jgi:hypothetical protein